MRSGSSAAWAAVTSAAVTTASAAHSLTIRKEIILASGGRLQALALKVSKVACGDDVATSKAFGRGAQITSRRRGIKLRDFGPGRARAAPAQPFPACGRGNQRYPPRLAREGRGQRERAFQGEPI